MWRLIFIAALLILVGCPQDPVKQKAEGWLLKVNGETVPEAGLVLYWAQREVFGIQDPVARLKVATGLAQHFGEETAFEQQARAAGVTVSVEEVNRAARKSAAEFRNLNFIQLLNQEKWTLPAFQKQLKKRLLIKRYFQREKEKLTPVSEEQLRKYYEEKIVSKMNQEEVRALHLLLDTREEAEYVREQLVGRSALPFEVAARRFSKSPEADKGGALDWFGKGAMPQVFDVCFQLKVDEISGVVPSEYGFHLFKLSERRRGLPSTFDEKKEFISKVLRQSQEESLIAASQKALADKKAIEIHDENLEKRLLELSAQVVFVLDETTKPAKNPAHAH